MPAWWRSRVRRSSPSNYDDFVHWWLTVNPSSGSRDLQFNGPGELQSYVPYVRKVEILAVQEPTAVREDEQAETSDFGQRAGFGGHVGFVVRFGEAADVPVMRVADDDVRAFLRRAHADD